jgi:hypothetical protein
VKCPNCTAEIQKASPYCLSCGKVPKVSSGPSYSLSWLFAVIGLCIVGIYWIGVTASREEAVRAIPTPTPVLDAAARLAQQCGRPDGQNPIPAKPQTKQLERQVLLYKLARVKAVFERDSPQSSDGWKNVKYLDATSGKQLNSQQMMKRLPCGVRIAPPPQQK